MKAPGEVVEVLTRAVRTLPPIYPALIGLLAVVALTVNNGAWLAASGRALVVIAIAAIVVTALLVALLRDRHRGAAVAALLVAALWSVRSPETIVPFLAAIVLIAVEWFATRRGRLKMPWQRITEGLTVMLAVILILELAQAVPAIRGTRQPQFDPAWSVAAQPGDRPNIYILLADGHARPDVLEQVYDLDMTPVADRLSASGFELASNSRSNYTLTEFSLAGLLSGSHLSDLGQAPTVPVDHDLVRAAIDLNPAVPYLHRAGYSVTALSGGWEGVSLRNVDHFIDTGPVNDLEFSTVLSSAIGKAWPRETFVWNLEIIRSRFRSDLNVLEEIASSGHTRPVAVFAHLPLPHVPFAFNADCSPIEEPVQLQIDDPIATQAVEPTAAQTVCVDALIADTLERIVAKDPGAVILWLSDHGPGVGLEDWAPGDPRRADRVKNLFMARTPGHPGLFPDDVTLVNVIPLLFNAYFGAQLPLRPDDSYFGPEVDTQTFTRITDFD